MNESFEIRPVQSRSDQQALLHLPWQLYQDDPNWTPPLLSMRKELLDKKHNPAWQYLDGEYFLAWRGGEAVGSIAAFVNPRHNERHQEKIAWFGLFECIKDEIVALGLLRTAVEWARERGYSAIRGPASFSLHAECGLLIENFDPAVLMMSYNPPYYANFIEDAGFSKVMDVYSWAFYADEPAQEAATERALRIAKRLQRRQRIQLRTFNSRDKKNEYLRLRHLYNSGWINNWGFVPMTEAELDALIASLGLLIEPELCIFAEVEGPDGRIRLDHSQSIGSVTARPATSWRTRSTQPFAARLAPQAT